STASPRERFCLSLLHDGRCYRRVPGRRPPSCRPARPHRWVETTQTSTPSAGVVPLAPGGYHHTPGPGRLVVDGQQDYRGGGRADRSAGGLDRDAQVVAWLDISGNDGGVLPALLAGIRPAERAPETLISQSW